MRRYGWWLFWGLAALLLFFGNGQLWITDSVESNYALTAKEMVLSGDWISPQIYGNYWYDKPVFFYWLTAAGFKIFGFNEFAARFFPALFGMAGLGLLVYAAKKLYGEKNCVLERRYFNDQHGVFPHQQIGYYRQHAVFLFQHGAGVFLPWVQHAAEKITITACIQAWRWQP